MFMNKLIKSKRWKSEICLVCATDQVILKALRDSSHASIPTSSKDTGNLPADNIHSANEKFPRTEWWISELVHPQTIKKRQDASSYNLNSFGLRYGK